MADQSAKPVNHVFPGREPETRRQQVGQMWRQMDDRPAEVDPFLSRVADRVTADASRIQMLEAQVRELERRLRELDGCGHGERG